MIDIAVEHADAFERATDLLVLKYAQDSYGVDLAASTLIGGLPTEPRPGFHCFVSSPRGMAARGVAFLGVEPLSRFGYSGIRAFARRAVAVAATERLNAAEISMTLHGTGYGLDEAAAFRAELAGVLDAVGNGEAEPGLQRVVVVETDPRSVRRLREVLRESLDKGRAPGDLQAARRTLEPAGSDTAQRAFVSMPFDELLEDRFYYGIAPPLHAAGLVCERLDKVSFTGDIVQAMERRIRSAEVVVADISTANPNVYLEIGYAWAARRPTILLCDTASEPRFNVRGHRYLRFTSIRELEEQLATEIAALRSRAVP